ncbi:unnamed protein product, partial [Urochloa humidicola]
LRAALSSPRRPDPTRGGRSGRLGSPAARSGARRPKRPARVGRRGGAHGGGPAGARRAAGSSCRRRRLARGSAAGEEQRWPELVELEEPGRARGPSSWTKQSGGDGDPALPRGRTAAGDGGDAALPLAVVLPPFCRKPPRLSLSSLRPSESSWCRQRPSGPSTHCRRRGPAPPVAPAPPVSSPSEPPWAQETSGRRHVIPGAEVGQASKARA